MSDNNELEQPRSKSGHKTHQQRNQELIQKMSEKSRLVKNQQLEKSNCKETQLITGFKTNICGANQQKQVTPIKKIQTSGIQDDQQRGRTNSNVLKNYANSLENILTDGGQISPRNLEEKQKQFDDEFEKTVLMGTLEQNKLVQTRENGFIVSLAGENVHYPSNVNGQAPNQQNQNEKNIANDVMTGDVSPKTLPRRNQSDDSVNVDFEINFNADNLKNNDSFGDINPEQTGDQNYIEETLKLISGKDNEIFIPESLLMLDEIVHQIDQIDQFKNELDTTQSKPATKTELFLYDGDDLIDESESLAPDVSLNKNNNIHDQCQHSKQTNNKQVDLQSISNILPKTQFELTGQNEIQEAIPLKQEENHFQAQNEIQIHGDAQITSIKPQSSHSSEERVKNLINSLQSNGIDNPENLIAEIISMQSAEKTQILTTLKQIENGNHNNIEQLKQLNDSLKPPKIAYSNNLQRKPKCLLKSGQIAKEGNLNGPKVPQVLQSRQPRNDKSPNICRDGISPNPINRAVINKQMQQSPLLVFELSEIFSTLDPVGVQLPQINYNGKQIQLYAVYQSTSDQQKCIIVTNKLNKLNAIPDQTPIYLIPLIQNNVDYSQFSVLQTQNKSKIKLAIVKLINIRLYNVFHIQHEELRTICTKFLYDGQYRQDSTLIQDCALHLPLIPNPAIGDLPCQLKPASNTQLLPIPCANNVSRSKSNLQRKTLLLPLNLKNNKDILTIEFLDNYGNKQYSGLQGIQFFDENGIEFYVDAQNIIGQLSTEQFRVLTNYQRFGSTSEEDNLIFQTQSLKLQIFIDKNKLAAIRIINCLLENMLDACCKQIIVQLANQQPKQVILQQNKHDFIIVKNMVNEINLYQKLLANDRISTISNIIHSPTEIVKQNSSNMQAEFQQIHHAKIKQCLSYENNQQELGIQFLQSYSQTGRFCLHQIQLLSTDHKTYNASTLRIDSVNKYVARINGYLIDQNTKQITLNHQNNSNAADLLDIELIEFDMPITVYFTFEAAQQFHIQHILLQPSKSAYALQKAYFYFNNQPLISQLSGVNIMSGYINQLEEHLIQQLHDKCDLSIQHHQLQQITQIITLKNQTPHNIEQALQHITTPIQFFIHEQYKQQIAQKLYLKQVQIIQTRNKMSSSQLTGSGGSHGVQYNNSQNYIVQTLPKGNVLTISVLELHQYAFDAYDTLYFGLQNLIALNSMKERINSEKIVNNFEIYEQSTEIVQIVTDQNDIVKITAQDTKIQQKIQKNAFLMTQYSLISQDQQDFGFLQFINNNVKRIQVSLDQKLIAELCLQQNDQLQGICFIRGQRINGEQYIDIE